MRWKKALAKGVLGLGFAVGGYADNIKINEVVTDPQQDHGGSGTIGPNDEYFELYNIGLFSTDLTGWRVEMLDTTPETNYLSGSIPSHGYFYLLNPAGQMNNEITLNLYNSQNGLLDSLYIADGNATSLRDESNSLFPDGINNLIKTYATPNSRNVPEPSTFVLGGLAAIILGRRR